MANESVFGVFPSLEAAGIAIRTLLERGVPRPSMNLLAHGGRVGLVRDPIVQHNYSIVLPDVPKSTEPLPGHEVRLTGIELPQIGPVLAMGNLAVSIRQPANSSNQIIAGLMRMGVTLADANNFLLALREGKSVLGVECPLSRVSGVAQTLGRVVAICQVREAQEGQNIHLREPKIGRVRGISFPGAPTDNISFFLPSAGLPGEPIFPKEPPKDPPEEPVKEPGAAPSKNPDEPALGIRIYPVKNPYSFEW
jgi:hypothetical protein